jgi:acetyl-CoA carboxylase carboxyl transferase subunit beta
MFCASGAARVQEGIISLLQMQKTAQACARHGQEGLLYISVLTNPTMGGVTASFATLADIILAEKNALIGFTGQRVITQTTGEVLPEGFQTADFQKEHGFVDEVVSNEDMREYLGELLNIFLAPKHTEVRDKTLAPAEKGKISLNPEGAWKSVKLARKITRPTTKEYINRLFTGFVELHGDRLSGDDHAMLGGIAYFKGSPVVAIGQQKGKKDVKEALYRNWGMVSPSGHHKAIRLMKMAEKFGFPIVCFVDTIGAACGKSAEEMGQADILAQMLSVASELKTPVLSIIIGEAGSGGALAFSVANEVWMLEHSVFSVITPEGYASIVWKDIDRASEASEIMGMCASQLYEKGVIDRVISEKEPVTENSLEAVCGEISVYMAEFFERYGQMTEQEIVENRFERYRRF